MNYRDVRDFLPFHIDGRKDEQRRISYIKNSKKKVVFYGCQYCVGDIFYKFLKKIMLI